MSDFADRFALARFSDGGLLVDLARGTVHRLNATAAQISAALIDHPTRASAVDALITRWPIERARLDHDVTALLAALDAPDPAPPDRAAKPGLHWTREPDGASQLTVDATPVARFDAATQRIDLLDGADRVGTAAALQWVAPHALMAQGTYVFHASAVQTEPGEVDAFVGASGAGKTTLARALVEAGAGPVSEDLVVVELGEGDARIAVCTAGEARVREWAASERGPRVDARALRDAVKRSDRAALRRVLLVDAARRRGTAFTIERPGAVDACAEVLVNSFAEVDSEAVWRLAVRGAERVAASGVVGRVSVPSGVGAVKRAAGGYRVMMRGETE